MSGVFWEDDWDHAENEVDKALFRHGALRMTWIALCVIATGLLTTGYIAVAAIITVTGDQWLTSLGGLVIVSFYVARAARRRERERHVKWEPKVLRFRWQGFLWVALNAAVLAGALNQWGVSWGWATSYATVSAVVTLAALWGVRGFGVEMEQLNAFFRFREPS